MTTRPTDPRGANRRGSDNADLGYRVDVPARIVAGKRWATPSDIHGILRYTRQRAATGRCVVCGATTTTPGVTCKSIMCISCWVLGHM